MEAQSVPYPRFVASYILSYTLRSESAGVRLTLCCKCGVQLLFEKRATRIGTRIRRRTFMEMNRRFTSSCTLAAVLGIVFGLCTFAQGPGGNANPSSVPRMADGRPDFSGFWTIPYVPNIFQGKEDTIPYTERGREAYRSRDLKNDPTSNCWYGGVPRIMQSPYPIQIVQTHEFFVILYEDMHTWRSIPLSGRPHPTNMEPAFLGDSVGHWEGDTLVVDTANLKDAPWTWLDTSGHQHSDALHVIERFERKEGTIAYTYTLDDPKMFTALWTTPVRTFTPLKTYAGLPEIIEYSCTENNKDVQHLISTKPPVGK
ncbi:MAG: hypothetical protein C5B58_00910 [Acidobacteria bacterium]|nr:MAG: hypothetical protein C5B58_00910 [Acidobacteriota bacterium]